MTTQHRNDTPNTKAPSPAGDNASGVPVITMVAEAARRRRKLDVQAAWSALIVGLRKNYAPAETFRMPGGTLTRDELAARLQRFIASAEKTKAKQREYLAAVQAERRTFAELRSTYDCAVSILRGHHGKASRQLLEFGIAPAKPRQVSVATQLVAVEKANATRIARGTMGKRQREKIHGVLPPDGPAAAIVAASRPEARVGVAPAKEATAPSQSAEARQPHAFWVAPSPHAHPGTHLQSAAVILPSAPPPFAHAAAALWLTALPPSAAAMDSPTDSPVASVPVVRGEREL